jgi:hypothetical protein
MMRLSRWSWLGERSRPHYGQLTLTLLLICALFLFSYFHVHWAHRHGATQRLRPATVLSFLPDSILLSRAVFDACGVLFVIGAIFWGAQLLIPWSGWLTALSFTAVLALYMENAIQCTHVAHVTSMLLLLYALWYQLYARDIRGALREMRFWSTELYPRWVHSLSVFYLGLFYGLSGVNKLLASGPGWANGTALQLWTYLWGERGSPFTQVILWDRTLAQGMQWLTLIGETGGLVAIFSRRLRPLIGLLLISFHVAAISVFKWGFHANLFMLALVFLPFDYWVPRWVAWLEGRSGPPHVIQYPPTWWGTLRRGVRARLDVLSRARLA